MSMTKKEQQQMEALRMERDMYRAMNISQPVEPDLKGPHELPFGSEHFVKGYLPQTFHSYTHSGGAEKAASNRIYHRVGSDAWNPANTSWTQRPEDLYSKRSQALLASRHWASKDMAFRLAHLDREIAKALEEERGA